MDYIRLISVYLGVGNGVSFLWDIRVMRRKGGVWGNEEESIYYVNL